MGGLTAEVYDILYQSTLAEADPGEGSPPPQLFVDQTEARGGEITILETRLPAYLRVWMTGCPQGLDLELHSAMLHNTSLALMVKIANLSFTYLLL